MNREEAMDKEFSKTPGGNYFNYVDTAQLERLGITQYKPQLGDNAIRIVYPPSRPGFYGLEVFKHSNVGVNRKTFICQRKMFEEACPICDYADSLRKEDPQDARAKELYASRRYLFFVVDVLTEEGMKKGIRWFDCPIGVYNEIKSRSKNKRRGQSSEGKDFKKYIDVSHPVDGRDIEFEQTKIKGKYDYEGVTLVTSEPIPEDWYKDLPEFKDILKISSVEEIQEALSGEAEPDEKVETEGTTEEETERGEVETEVQEDSQDEVVEEENPKKETSSRTVSARGVNPSKESAKEKDSDIRARVQARLRTARQSRTGEEAPGEVEE